jgi:CRISPR-associated protein Cas5d
MAHCAISLSSLFYPQPSKGVRLVTDSPTLALRVRGPLAVFSAPELKTERVSTPVITPSAARGVYEAVLWKPAIRWHIERIRVLSEINFVAFRRNEVNRKASLPSAIVVKEGGAYADYFADDDRAQRNTVALRDVDYVIEAHFSMTDRAGPADNVAKFVDMFRRRIDRGQHFHAPYLGCREFSADVLSADEAPPPIPITRSFGRMLLDIDYGPTQNRPIFFDAVLNAGVMEVPPISVDRTDS